MSDPNYANETFRSRHHYKEHHQHDAPYRRSRDFKPVPYGTFRGMPNYKHSEPYCLLKNMKDLANEDHHHPIKWIKQGLKGGLLGSIFGYMYFLGGPTGAFEFQKLQASMGERKFSFRAYRLAKNVLGKYAFMGAGILVSYQMTYDFLRHHDEANSRPYFFDHMIATTLIGTFFGALTMNHPLHVFCSGFFSAALVAPSLWWLSHVGRLNSTRSSNVFYQNDCTQEEVDRFRHQDMIEHLGVRMLADPGFGYHAQGDPRAL